MAKEDSPPEAAKPKLASDLPKELIEKKIQEWLNNNAVDDFKGKDWTSSLLPHMSLVDLTLELPHPSITLSYTVQPEHCNQLKNLHGGCASTLFDFSTSMAIVLVSRPDFWNYLGVSRTLNVTYLRPVPSGTEVLVHNEIVQIGKKMTTLRGTMRRRSDGALLAVCEHGKVNVDFGSKI
ncbi:unnamed protein product [Clonostachys byssicola]|uniref:Thioesterase domain-containing protein n=1 Tax=Clonostachys byssicola TaxID=160290 RepID=A0A9N9UTB5_9HYPO|nr:unnamed protein product [Clonostachys byssicola]